MKDIVDRYNSARVEPAPKEMLDEAMIEVVRLRKLVVEFEKREKHLEEMFHGWRDEACKADARIAELKAENGNLRKALKPFAAVTDRDLELWYGLDPDPFVPDDAGLITIDSSPTVGDLRAARAALKGEK